MARKTTYRTINPTALPDIRTTDKGRKLAAVQPFTVLNYMHIIQALGYRLRFNIMSGEVEVWDTFDDVVLNPDAAFKAFEVFDDALVLLHISTTRAPNVRTVIAAEDTYHPMGLWIDAVEWDGVDRFAELAATVPTDTELWPVYLRKWLIQLMEGVFGWEDDVERSLPHVLTFTGLQGVNKGRWIRSLGVGRFVKADAELHLGGGMQKDSLLDVLSKPIAELGEIDATFKAADVSSLKSFLSRPVDSIRKPYARNPVVRHRMTCFMGSVNRMEFLVDATGSRRFWPVALKADCKLDWDHGIDMQQVFAQAQVLWAEGEDWNLSEDENLDRIVDAKTFTEVPAIADLAHAYWEPKRNDMGNYALLNKTQIAQTIGGGTHPVQLRQLGDWLNANLGPCRKVGVQQRVWGWPGALLAGHEKTTEDIAKKSAKIAQETARWSMALVFKI